MYDLCIELSKRGDKVTVFTPDSSVADNLQTSIVDGLEVVRIRAPRSDRNNRLLRLLQEASLSLLFFKNLRQTDYLKTNWDAIIWYSPTIFLSFFIHILKKKSRARTYLIIRDIFPDWALDVGLIRKGIAFWVLKAISRYQYKIADRIGIQSPSNIVYFSKQESERVEVLNNWLSPTVIKRSSIQLSDTILRNKKVLVYSGNIGVAQSIDWVLSLSQNRIFNEKYGVLIIGTGSEVERIQKLACTKNIDSVLFHSEIEHCELVDLYSQCVAGIVSLDERHKSHNIPGKFINYIINGLPIVARVNPLNDLIKIINDNKIGIIVKNIEYEKNINELVNYLDMLESDSTIKNRCIDLAQCEYNVSSIVNQIKSALSL